MSATMQERADAFVKRYTLDELEMMLPGLTERLNACNFNQRHIADNYFSRIIGTIEGMLIKQELAS